MHLTIIANPSKEELDWSPFILEVLENPFKGGIWRPAGENRRGKYYTANIDWSSKSPRGETKTSKTLDQPSQAVPKRATTRWILISNNRWFLLAMSLPGTSLRLSPTPALSGRICQWFPSKEFRVQVSFHLLQYPWDDRCMGLERGDFPASSNRQPANFDAFFDWALKPTANPRPLLITPEF